MAEASVCGMGSTDRSVHLPIVPGVRSAGGVYTLTLLLLLFASQRQSPVLWIASGVCLGATVLTRSNGLVVLLTLGLP
jgi:hypothetical protein